MGLYWENTISYVDRVSVSLYNSGADFDYVDTDGNLVYKEPD